MKKVVNVVFKKLEMYPEGKVSPTTWPRGDTRWKRKAIRQIAEAVFEGRFDDCVYHLEEVLKLWRVNIGAVRLQHPLGQSKYYDRSHACAQVNVIAPEGEIVNLNENAIQQEERRVAEDEE